MQRLKKLLDEGTLFGVSGSEEGIKKIISKFFGGATITLKDNGDGTFDIHNKKGLVKSTIVRKVKNRFRFETQ